MPDKKDKIKVADAKKAKANIDRYNGRAKKDQEGESTPGQTGISDSMLNSRLRLSPIFDGEGRFKTPLDTSNRYTSKEHFKFTVHFYTQQGEFNASYALGRRDSDNTSSDFKQNEMNEELIGFDTENDNSKDINIMSIKLFAFREWEQILRPNDYVTLTVSIYAKNGGDNGTTWKTLTLMTGLVSNISLSESLSTARVYTITCQGVQKILSDVNLGLPSNISSSGGFLLFDINGNSSPMYETYGSDSSDSDSDDAQGNTVGVPKDVRDGYNKIKKACLKYGKAEKILSSLCVCSAYKETALGTAKTSSVPLGSNNFWGIEGADVGLGTVGSAHDTKFKSLEQGVQYYFKLLAGKTGSVQTKGVVGNKNFKDCARIISSSNYMEDHTGYYQAMLECYNSLQLWELDKEEGL